MPTRFTTNDAPPVIPIFPLPGALVLPRGRLPLNIFEPRYLVLVDDTLKTDHRLIGMIQPRNDSDDSDPSPLYDIGCAGRLSTLSETDDGRYLIGLNGVSRFRVQREIEGFTPYRQAEVAWEEFRLDTKEPQMDCPDFDKAAFLSLVEQYFKLRSFDTDWDALHKADEETIVNAVCMMCPFSAAEKQALLEAEDLTARASTLQAILEIEVAGEESSGGIN